MLSRPRCAQGYSSCAIDSATSTLSPCHFRIRAMNQGGGPMSAANHLDLSGLYQSPVFHSSTAVQSHEQLSTCLSSHGLTWGRGRVDTTLFRRDIQQISLMALGYGAEVEVQADAFQDFCLVQMPLRGTAEFMCDGHLMTAFPGDIAVVSPRRHVRTLWQAGCEQLLLKVPHSLFDGLDASELSAQQAVTAYKINARLAPQWAALIQHLLATAPTQTDIHPSWLRHLETGLALFLLCHQPLGETARPASEAQQLGPSARAARARLHHAEAYVLSHLQAPITLADLAQAAGLSSRALHILCRRHHGESPMSWLRNLRLDAARKRFLTDPQASVTDVALACGFGHLGRFSAYYQARFSEQPRRTGLRQSHR